METCARMHYDRDFPFAPLANVFLFIVGKDQISSLSELADVSYLIKIAKCKINMKSDMNGYDRFIRNIEYVEKRGLELADPKPVKVVRVFGNDIHIITRRAQMKHVHGWYQVVYETQYYFMMLLENPMFALSSVPNT